MNFGEDTPASPTSATMRDESGEEGERSATPGPEEAMQGTQRRKSGTFWRRKSNMTMGGAVVGMNGKENQPLNVGVNGGSTGPMGGHANDQQRGMTNGRHEGEEDATMEDADRDKSLPELEEPLPPRSYSPPPQLPVFVGGGGGLGGEELFKDIH